ncbi:hypothetical protein [Amycolatopsis sp. H20-H5]|uniref:hypothetical protein n=1 Tax=Amycolatopsis sp. H20-H5 TaxID=3046309 RepID=UPI002DB5F6FF|nr:hypothetical protein [Amycolatopsis sp. H20-H5]MEC3979293.1 hypothetical protein [Amycolatopsis sp. H20-H5]
MKTTVRKRVHLTWVTAVTPVVDHAVTDDGFAAGLAAGDGVYVGICGVRFVPASLISEPGAVCSRCKVVLTPVPGSRAKRRSRVAGRG